MIKILLLALLVLVSQANPSRFLKIHKEEVSSHLVRVMSFNTYFLFDQEDDPAVEWDQNFAPKTEAAYQKKLEGISSVILKNEPDLIGLQEVENKKVLEDLNVLLKNRYSILHFESKDLFTGQDVALFYNPQKLKEIREMKHNLDFKASLFGKCEPVSEVVDVRSAPSVQWPQEPQTRIQEEGDYRGILEQLETKKAKEAVMALGTQGITQNCDTIVKDRTLSKGILETEFEVLGTKEKLAVLVTHLKSQTGGWDADLKRTAQANTLRKKIEEVFLYNKKIVILGDFNDINPSPVIETITGESQMQYNADTQNLVLFYDTLVDYPVKENYTYVIKKFLMAGGKRRYMGTFHSRIDYIFISPWLKYQAKEAWIDSSYPIEKKMPSDHFPILLNLDFSPASSVR